jgi:serine protease Do
MSPPAASRHPLLARLARKALLAAGMAVGAAGGYFAAAQVPPAYAQSPTALTGKRRDALVDIVERVKAAVVNIHSERTVAPGIDDPFRPSGVLKPQRQRGMGTGIVLDPRGYVVTNFHVVSEIESLRAALHDGKSLPARVIATDKKADLALVKIDPPTPLPTVPLGTAADLLDAEQVIAIGNAFGYEHTVSVGNVAYKSRDVELNKEISYQGLIQTTAPINPGNSGGPLFNKKGELIGVNVAIRAGAQNIAFAIPVDTMIDRAADMLSARKRGGVRHGLAVRDRHERTAEEAPVRRWVEVAGTEPDSPAAAAGLRAGDVVERVGDLDVLTSIDVERGFLDRPAGAAVPVRVRRGAETVSLTVALQPADRGVGGPAAETVYRRLGVRVQPVGKEAVARVDGQLRGGLLVVDASPAGAAAKAGLQRGDILLGFQLAEALEAISLDNVVFVLAHPNLARHTPLKTFYVRDGKLRETSLTPE